MPEGHFQTLDREGLWHTAESALEHMEEALGQIQDQGPARCLVNVALGETPRQVIAGPEAFPPVSLALNDGRRVEIHGHLPCLFHLPVGTATLVALPHDLRLNRLLSPFLFYLTGLLSDSRLGEWLRAGPFTVYYLHRLGESFLVRKWPPFDVAPEAARAYLQALLDPMLSGADFDHLPFDLVIDALIDRKGGNKWEGSLAEGVDYAQVLRETLEEQEPGDRFAAYKPKESVKILGPRVPADATAKLQGRLGAFFNWK